jgi:hypothetical protein
VLKDNEIYRVADALGFVKRERFTTDILDLPEYKDSILYKYFTDFRGNKYDHELLYRCTKEYMLENDIFPYGEEHVLMHMRTGDDIRNRGLQNPKNSEFYLEELEKYPDQKLVVVTAMHFGHKDGKSKWYGDGGKNIYTDEKYEQNIELLDGFLGSIDRDMEICSNRDIDRDLCYLVFSKNVIISPYAGGFAKLIIKLRELYNG